MSTQLLLIEDVDHLGRSGDIVKVKPGYARNYLLPRGFAYVADKRAIHMQERLREERLKKAAVDLKDAQALAAKLETVSVETTVKVDQEGHMYGSVSTADILHLLEQQHGILLEKKYVLLKHPIKALGEHTIELKLKEGVEAKFKLSIFAEGATL